MCHRSHKITVRLPCFALSAELFYDSLSHGVYVLCQHTYLILPMYGYRSIHINILYIHDLICQCSHPVSLSAEIYNDDCDEHNTAKHKYCDLSGALHCLIRVINYTYIKHSILEQHRVKIVIILHITCTVILT